MVEANNGKLFNTEQWKITKREKKKREEGRGDLYILNKSPSQALGNRRENPCWQKPRPTDGGGNKQDGLRFARHGRNGFQASCQDNATSCKATGTKLIKLFFGHVCMENEARQGQNVRAVGSEVAGDDCSEAEAEDGEKKRPFWA